MAKLVPWGKLYFEDDDIPVAIISLEEAQSRRSTLIERGFPTDLVNGFWPACDMRGLPDSALHSYKEYFDIKRIYGRPPVSAELGCLFSHTAIIKWLAEQDVVSSVIIFEDDVVLDESNGFEGLTQLAEGLSGFAKSGKPYICHLGLKKEQWKFALTRKILTEFSLRHEQDLFNLVDSKSKIWRAHAYIISKRAAKQYLEMVDKTGFLADDWKFIISQTSAKFIFVTPPMFTQDEEVVSTIDPNKERELVNSQQAHNGNNVSKSTDFRKNVNNALKAIKRSLKTFAFRCFRTLPGKKLY
jgi:GR25 family glycosyltransferase involved in LPS biosynthesis|nr:glycosyltransferase family 25 protein [uncultured Halomonas sp.]|tara:strand:- start:3736 stop:4632 length:897 start_codon:yes stop_codon:yes gene_type:complete